MELVIFPVVAGAVGFVFGTTFGAPPPTRWVITAFSVVLGLAVAINVT